MGKGGGGNIPQVTAQQVDYTPIVAQYQKGADVIEQQFPIALENYLEYAGQGARDAITANTSALITTLPYGSAANSAVGDILTMLGLPQQSKTQDLSYKMDSLTQQLDTAPFISMNFIGDMKEQLTSLTNQLSRAEDITDPELRQQYKDQLVPQFDALSKGIEADRANWSNFQKYLSSDYSKQPVTQTKGDVVAFSIVGGFRQLDSKKDKEIVVLKSDGTEQKLMGDAAQKVIDDYGKQGAGLLDPSRYYGSQTLTSMAGSYSTLKPEDFSSTGGISYIPTSTDPFINTGDKYDDIAEGALSANTAGKLLQQYNDYYKNGGNTPGSTTVDASKYVAFDQLTDEQKKELGFADVPQSDLAGITGLDDFINRYDQLSDVEKLQSQSLVNWVSGLSPDLQDVESRFSQDYGAEPPKPGDPTDIMNRVTSLPTYQFGLQQGQQSLQRSQAARGILNSGQAALEATQYGQNYAQNAYQSQLGQLSGLAGLTLGFPTQQSNLQQTGGVVQAAANTDAGANRQSSIQGVANARNGAYVNSGNAMTQIGIANQQAALQAAIANQQAAIAKAQMQAQSSMGIGQLAGSLLGAFL